MNHIADVTTAAPPTGGLAPPRLLRWRAPDERAEAALRDRLRRDLAAAAPDGFAAVAADWSQRGVRGAVRGAVVAAGPREALEALDGSVATRGHGRVALMFPGQGAQQPAMATGLYGWDPVFTAAMDEVFYHLGAAGPRIRADWLAAEPAVDLDDVSRAQPLLFAVDYALGRAAMSWGAAPAALIGHSVGEVVAACLSGVFAVADAAALLWDRVVQIGRTPPGGMLAVHAGVDDVAPYLSGDVVVAAVNAPRQTMLAGPRGPLEEAAGHLRGAGFIVRFARATSAFHSPALADAAAASIPAYAGVRLRRPHTPLYSAYTGTRMTDSVALDPAFWAGQPAAPVLFWPALDELLAGPELLLVEAGPGAGLAALARRHRAVARGGSAVTAMLPAHRGGPVDDQRAFLSARAAVWLAG